jgi:hypothetical protein
VAVRPGNSRSRRPSFRIIERLPAHCVRGFRRAGNLGHNFDMASQVSASPPINLLRLRYLALLSVAGGFANISFKFPWRRQ